MMIIEIPISAEDVQDYMDEVDRADADPDLIDLTTAFETIEVIPVPGGVEIRLMGEHEDETWSSTAEKWAEDITSRHGVDARLYVPTNGVGPYLHQVEWAYVGATDTCNRWRGIHWAATALLNLKNSFGTAIWQLRSDDADMDHDLRQGALWLALVAHNTDALERAIEAGADLREPDFMGTPPIDRLIEHPYIKPEFAAKATAIAHAHSLRQEAAPRRRTRL